MSVKQGEKEMKEKKPLLEGQRFGRLTVLSLHHTKEYIRKSGKKQTANFYLCKCDCGKTKIINKWALLSGHTLSCGCFQKEIASKCNSKHRKTKTRIYNIWGDIKKRCFNKKCNSYKNYCGRGITMCDEWKNDFMSFYNWAIANGYKDNLTIDRINNNGNYEPSNCRWVDRKEQARNRRTSVFVKYKNTVICLKELAERLGVNYKTLWSKIKRRAICK